ncbi:MAG TPA: CoA pyrophosphatase [Candidatus Nitrosopelagicus sp.]|nr:CoA pyrophosphatase [Candidatus Nitrosopelagicus sp.]
MNLEKIKTALTSKINPKINNSENQKPAAVLIIIYDNPPKILMTKKPTTMAQHGGEISFPGGKLTNSDYNLLETALRETKEETGLDISKKYVIGQLDQVTTLNSGFTILPFVCVLDSITNLVANSEVETFLQIPLIPFLETLENDIEPEHNSIQEMYLFTFEKNIIWGASARMLKKVKENLTRENCF